VALPPVKPEFTSQIKQEDLDKMKMQPKKRTRQPATTKTVVSLPRRKKVTDEEEVKSDIEEREQPQVSETVGINFSSYNLIVTHKHKNKDNPAKANKKSAVKQVVAKDKSESDGNETDVDEYGQLFDS
jgi:hypothetical protein